jgi:hypothetical protein
LYDLQESFSVVFEKLLPEALGDKLNRRAAQKILWDIREEFRHIEYHINDVEGR